MTQTVRARSAAERVWEVAAGGTADRGDASTRLGVRRPFHRRLPRRPGTRVSVHPRGGGVRLTVAGASAEWREGGGEARFERVAAEQPPPDLSLRPTGRPTGALGPRGTGSPATRGQRRAAGRPRPSPDGQLGSRAGGPTAHGNRCARRSAGRRRRRPAAPGSGHSHLARGRGVGVRPKLGLRACHSLRARSWETFFLLQPLKRAAQGKVVWNSLFPAGEPLPRRFNGNFAGLPLAWELLSPRRKKWGCLSL